LSSERKVERELLDDLKRVAGKQNLLFALAEATLAEPDGVVREVVFPVVGEQTLQDLVKEWKANAVIRRWSCRWTRSGSSPTCRPKCTRP
jgi:hypothetical protein